MIPGHLEKLPWPVPLGLNAEGMRLLGCDDGADAQENW